MLLTPFFRAQCKSQSFRLKQEQLMIGQSVRTIVFIESVPLIHTITSNCTHSCSRGGGYTPHTSGRCGGRLFSPLGCPLHAASIDEDAIVCSKLIREILDKIKYWLLRVEFAFDSPCSGMINHNLAGVLSLSAIIPSFWLWYSHGGRHLSRDRRIAHGSCPS